MIADLSNLDPADPVRLNVWRCSSRVSRKYATLAGMVADGGCPEGAHINMAVAFPTCWNGADWTVSALHETCRSVLLEQADPDDADVENLPCPLDQLEELLERDPRTPAEAFRAGDDALCLS